MNKSGIKQNIKTITGLIIWSLVVQLILINISAAFHAYRFTHYYNDDKIRNLPSSSGTIFLRTWRMMVGKKLAKSLIPYYPDRPYESVQFIAGNNIKVEGWYMSADSSIGTVILFHGLGSNKGNILSEALAFLSMHYNTLLIDMRAHGNSEGIVNSLGVKEAEEVKLAFDYVKKRRENNIVLWGVSLGAVIISKAICDYDIKPQKVILEMPFARLQDHLKARSRLKGFPDEPFGFLVTLWTGIEQGYWGFAHKTTKYVQKINCPVLLQWGMLDEYVLQKETESVFSNIASKEKSLIIYQAAGHESLVNKDRDKWEKTVHDFLTK